MNWNLYLRKRTLFVPTTGIVDNSFYREIEPVGVVPVTNIAAASEALHSAIAKGNPPVPIYAAGKYPQPAVLKCAGLKSWSSFARGCLSWSIKWKDGIYQITGDRMHPKGYWEEDPNQMTAFPLGTSVDDVIERMIAILQDAARQQVS